MANLSLNNIKKSFGDTAVLKGVDIQIHDKEFVTLVGPSGCGKSTLLRILAGLEQADEGTVSINGKNVTDVRPADRNLSMVFQSYALYPHLTIAQNMMTPLKLRDLSFTQRLPFIGPIFAKTKYKDLFKLVQDTAQTLKIEQLLNRKPGQLSGGQRQRAALGRAMVRDPLAFLMDEPLSNLDAALRVHMRAELSQLHQRLGATFVYVTHDQAEALTMSDRMAVMMNGHVLQYDVPDEIYRNPNSLEVAKFIGSPAINILPAEVSDDLTLNVLGKKIGVSVQSRLSSVSLGIRPEHIEVCDEQNSDLTGIVTHIENLGSDFFYHLTLDGLQKPVNLRVNADLEAKFALNDLLHFRLKSDRILVFGDDGRRVSISHLKAPSNNNLVAS